MDKKTKEKIRKELWEVVENLIREYGPQAILAVLIWIIGRIKKLWKGKSGSIKPRSRISSQQCEARTKAGKRCKRPAVGRSKYCSVHKRGR